MVRGVIFDLDGTLGDTLPVCFAAFRQVFSEFLGVDHTDAEIRAMFGPTEEGILVARIPHADGRAIERYHEMYAAAHHLAPRPFAGLTATLDWLAAAGIKVGIVTGKGARSATTSLERWGLAGRFDPVEAGSDGGAVKDVKMRTVVDGWGVDPGEVVSVGDAPSDVHAARTAGLVPVGVAWASTADAGELVAEGPEAVFTDVASFDTWLRSQVGAAP